MDNKKAFEKLKSFFKTNYKPKYVKHKRIALLTCESADQVNDEDIHLVPMSKSDSFIIDFFRKTHFNIIAGEDKNLKRISPLEVFFKHRTDMIIAVNSDDQCLHRGYSSAFNSPVYIMDTLSSKSYYYVDNSLRYKISNTDYIENVKGVENLYTPVEARGKIMMIAEKSGRHDLRFLRSNPLFGAEKILNLETAYKSKVAVSSEEVSQKLERFVKGVLRASVCMNENVLETTLFVYQKDEKTIKEETKRVIEKITESISGKRADSIIKVKSVWGGVYEGECC